MGASLVSKTESRTFFHRICPELSLSDEVPLLVQLRASGEILERGLSDLACDGYMQLHRLVRPEHAGSLALCIERLVAEGVPPVFAFVYDPFWALFRDVAAMLGPLLDRQLSVLSDAWAWHVPAAESSGGWGPHRDYSKQVVREADGLPSRINVWIALTDAPIDHACLRLVPLGADGNYPSALNLHDTSGAKAVPVEAGTVVCWDANLIHWGGPANPHAKSPRISIAATLERTECGSARIDFSRPIPFQDRLDIIALQVVQYQHRDRSFPVELAEWARILHGLHHKLRGGR